jgi:hypothetical protein
MPRRRTTGRPGPAFGFKLTHNRNSHVRQGAANLVRFGMIARMSDPASRSHPIRNAFVALILILGFICTSVFVLKKLFAPNVTRANAQMLFDAFDLTAQKGDVPLRGDKLAADVAADGFRKQTDSPPLDGWGHPMRVTAKVTGNSCLLIVRSAGADDLFNTPDDMVIQRTFDISKAPGVDGMPTTRPDQ